MTETRSERKRAAIVAAAAEAFLGKGYRGTSMDEIAAAAAVSKQTVYKHFSDKETLFVEIISATGGRAGEQVKAVGTLLAETTADRLEPDLRALARQLIGAVMHPDILRLRRVVTAEAVRFPDLGQVYWDRAFGRAIETLAAALRDLDARGLLRVPEPVDAAGHFAGLLLWVPANRAMFTGVDEALPPAEVDRLAAAGVTAFLAAYRAA